MKITAQVETFSQTLRRLRRQAGLSQSGLARRTGFPANTIAQWESGRRKPLMDSLLTLARGLGTGLWAFAPLPVKKEKSMVRMLSRTHNENGKGCYRTVDTRDRPLVLERRRGRKPKLALVEKGFCEKKPKRKAKKRKVAK